MADIIPFWVIGLLTNPRLAVGNIAIDHKAFHAFLAK